MERFGGTWRELCSVDVSPIISWLEAIPLGDWPQQDRLSADYPYPAMVSDLAWHGFGAVTQGLVDGLMERFPRHRADHRMLSVVVPGQRIAEHDDVMPENWRVRIHVPLVTNPKAIMFFGRLAIHLDVGKAYLINTEINHSLSNHGDAPRIHVFFDVRALA